MSDLPTVRAAICPCGRPEPLLTKGYADVLTSTSEGFRFALAMHEIPVPFLIFAHFFWLISIIFNCINALSQRKAGKKVHVEHPELAGEYYRLIKGWLFWGNIPWVVMGFGCMFDGLTVFDYVRPRDGNPFVLAFYGILFVLWLFGFWWVILGGGAERLARCKFLPGTGWLLSNPLHIKLLVCLSLAGGIAGTVIMFTMDIPRYIPK